MRTRNGQARWDGDLLSGKGRVQFGDGAFDMPYTFKSRFEEGDGTNPEELIGAAHAGCFSMALSAALGQAGHKPVYVSTVAKVSLEKVEGGFKIAGVHLDTEAKVPGIDDKAFQQIAEDAKKNCPVSQALSALEIMLSAKLS